MSARVVWTTPSTRKFTWYSRLPFTGDVDAAEALATHVFAPTQLGSVSGAAGGTFLVVGWAFTVHVSWGILTSTVPTPVTVVTTSTVGVVTVAGQVEPMAHVVYPV